MSELVTIWTYDWVPRGPRGYVRDLRLRWALEEAGIDYVVATVPFDDRGPDHLARQPFAQIPFLEDGDIRVFESGACLLHLAEKSETLMPREARGKADTLQWLIAGLNSIEMVTVLGGSSTCPDRRKIPSPAGWSSVSTGWRRS
ncbi:glutathione S-transferase N-terminal domain-containing protein [Paracoccus methylarcula]|uniref:glutathione S-transferase N-terminal domain-containing protein n=1 Tax=Paracoccus methylarcula TaxID=72022 RepID=UPI001FE5DE59|nr:glutathione S-transferase N-terminal domain-containing protein [Paracoccus methylarcula]